MPETKFELSVTLPPMQNVVEPFVKMNEETAVTETDVVPAAEVQPLTVTVTEYVPAKAVVAFARVGFCCEEVNPFGPVHA